MRHKPRRLALQHDEDGHVTRWQHALTLLVMFLTLRSMIADFH